MKLKVQSLLLLAIPFSAASGADEILNAFGPWRIERIEENDSYQLAGVSTQGTKMYFRIACFPGQNHLSLLLPFPREYKSTKREITVVAWSDRPESSSLKLPVFKNAAAIGIIGKKASRYDESVAAFLRILFGAPKAFSYSIGPFSMTHDTFHLHAAVERFSELCGPMPVPLAAQQ